MDSIHCTHFLARKYFSLGGVGGLLLTGRAIDSYDDDDDVGDVHYYVVSQKAQIHLEMLDSKYSHLLMYYVVLLPESIM